jgi:drug/metabolite transporter (DMT)-like permease
MRCATCLRSSTVVADGEPEARRPIPRLLLAGVVVWSSALIARVWFGDRGHTVEARWEAGTLGALALTGFVATSIGAWRWWRMRR